MPKKQRSPNDQRSDSRNPNNQLSDIYFRSVERRLNQRFRNTSENSDQMFERLNRRFERLDRSFARIDRMIRSFEKR